MNARSAAVILVLALGVVAGCGSGSDDSGREVQEVVEQLKSLEKGEILIQGFSAPRVVGPYRFEPGGYVLRYTHEGGDRLKVALAQSQAQPSRLLVDSDRASGTKAVTLTGKLYVHIVAADGAYVLRFRPK